MARKWIRELRVTVSGAGGSATFTDLRIDFDITKTIGSKQNTGSVTIYNLSAKRRGQLGEEFDTIEVEAGYRGGDKAIILNANIRDVRHTKETADIKTTIECGDGDKGVNKGAHSKTYPKNTKPIEIVRDLVQQMPGVKLGRMEGLDELPAYKRPVSVFGWAHRELDQLSREHKFYWSIQNGVFQAIAHDRDLGGTVIISKETGMVGIPEITDKGVHVKTLLEPQIAPGTRIDVRSGFLDSNSGRDKRATDQGGGLFRVATVKFTGSNRDQAYYADIEANRIQGSKVVK